MDKKDGDAGVFVGAEPGQPGGFGIFVRIKQAGQAELLRPLAGEQDGEGRSVVGDEGKGVTPYFDGVLVERVVEGNLALIASEAGDSTDAIVGFVLAEGFARVLFWGAADGDEGGSEAIPGGFVFEILSFNFDLIVGQELKDGRMPALAGNVFVGESETADLEGSIPGIVVVGPDQGEDAVEGEIVGAAHFQVGRCAVKLGGQFLEGTQIKLPGDQGLFLFQLGGPGEGLRVAGEGGGQPGSDLVNGLDLLQFRNAGTATESKNNEQKSQEAHIKQGRQVGREGAQHIHLANTPALASIHRNFMTNDAIEHASLSNTGNCMP